MLRWIILYLVLQKVRSATVCDAGYCTCRQNESNFIFANCSSKPEVLQADLILPNATISLDLSKNNLKIIENLTLFQSNMLEELFLNDNMLMEIDVNVFQLPELKRLDLRDNQLQKLNPKIFDGIAKLEYLNLANNKFSLMSQLTFLSLINLKEIYLDNNDLGPDLQTRSLFDVNGYGLSLQIDTVSISKINLNNLPDNYFKLVLNSRDFKKLIASNNNLTQIFELPYYLLYLDLSDNPIQNLSTNIKEIINLDTLKLNNLNIEEIPNNTFAMMKNLELKNNPKLTNFSYLAFGKQILVDTYDFIMLSLSVRGSNLSTLDKKLKVLFEKLEFLDLQENPWLCDCQLAWVQELNISTDLTEDLRCASPPNLKNSKIFDLHPEDFVCPKTDGDSSGFGVGATLGIILYLILVLVTLIWIYIFLYQPGRAINKQEYNQLI